MSESTSVLTGPIPTFSKTVTGYRSVQTQQGDTLERLAMREIGNAAQWYDIAALNQLVPPYLTMDPALAGPGVALAGQTMLLVPSTAPAATGVAQAPDIFGTDCLLQNGQIQANGAGDFAIVSGLPNLAQALSVRLRTRPGELVYHPKYGCKAYTLVGRGNTAATNSLAAAYVGAAIKADPRVSQALNTTATTVGDVLSATSTAVAVNGKRLPVGVPGGVV